MPKVALGRLALTGFLCLLPGLSAYAHDRFETLRWQQSDLTNVAGFNVYVRQASESYDVPVDVGTATLEGGDIYFYDLLVPDDGSVYVVVTAYSSIGLESVFSNEKFLPGPAPSPPGSLTEADCGRIYVCWQQSDLTHLAGFNIYVGQTSGSYGPAIDIGVPTLEDGIYVYDLRGAVGGGAYVVVTAYSIAGVESVFSNERFFAPVFPSVLPALLYLFEVDE